MSDVATSRIDTTDTDSTQTGSLGRTWDVLVMLTITSWGDQ